MHLFNALIMLRNYWLTELTKIINRKLVLTFMCCITNIHTYIIALAFLKVKLHYCEVPLWKANKMYIFRGTIFFEPDKILVPISPFRFIAFIMKPLSKYFHVIKRYIKIPGK